MSSSIDDIDDEIFAEYQAKIDRLHEAMRVWMFTHAPDFCSADERKWAHDKIESGGGTLNFIATTIAETKIKVKNRT